jgi:3-dehydroquinate dehydratase-1
LNLHSEIVDELINEKSKFISDLQPAASLSSPGIVGIVHTESCLKKLSEESNALRLAGIDLLEVRLDVLPPSCSMPEKWPLPVITTARSPREGGLNQLSFIQRQHLLESSLPWTSMVDVELHSAKELASTIARAREAQRSIIFSFHDFQTVPSLAELQDLVVRAHDLGATIFKVAAMTQNKEELERLLEFQQLTHPLPVATMGMGHLGKISRLRLAEMGSALVYGWLYEPLSYAPASTQYSARELAQATER